MATGLHPADVALLRRLGTLVDVIDPVPESVVATGKGLFAFRDPDAALMEAVDTAVLPGSAVRGGWPSRVHFFEFDGGTPVSLDVELTVSDRSCEVLGTVTPSAGGPVPSGWTVVLETTGTRVVAEVEPDGRFVVEAVPLGMVRFLLDRGDAVPVATPWVDAR